LILSPIESWMKSIVSHA